MYYGRNKHEVSTPTYFEYMFDTMTQPFVLFQYVATVVFFLEGLFLFGAVLLLTTFSIATINYVILVLSYRKIRETA